MTHTKEEDHRILARIELWKDSVSTEITHCSEQDKLVFVADI